MFIYRFGPLDIKVTFDPSLKPYISEFQNYYKHAILKESEFHHSCHIQSWEIGGYTSKEEDIVIWNEHNVKVESERNIKIEALWDKDLNASIRAVEGEDYWFKDDRRKYWEFVQRISLYPRLVNHDGFMLHCAIVLVDNKANIFLGTSGAGKSTIAKKAVEAGYQVLTDDSAIFRFVNSKLTVFSAPYQSTSGLIGLPGEYEVEDFYVLTQKEYDSLTKIKRGVFLDCLLKQMYESQFWAHVFPFNGEGLGHSVGKKLMKKAYNISKKFDAYEYGFTLNSDLRYLFENRKIKGEK